LGIKRKGTIGVKFYTSRSGNPQAAVKAKPDPEKGFRPLKVHGSGTLRDRVRIGVGNTLGLLSSTPAMYKFTKNTMYVEVPCDINDAYVGSEYGL